MTTNLIGKNMAINILGAGLSCIDIIKETGSTYKSLGGTAANVISFLSMFSEMKTFFLLPSMKDDFIKKEFSRRDVEIYSFGKKPIDSPIIIERINNGSHSFSGVCPYCNYLLRKTKLPQISDINSLSFLDKDINLFYYDRVSSGIKSFVSNNKSGWNFYEPNSARSYNVFLENAKRAHIVKFSSDRIQENIVNKMLDDLASSSVEMVIITMGQKGLKYAIRENGSFNDWISVTSHIINGVKDTSGAGDWVTSIFLFFFLSQYPFYTKQINNNLVYNYLRYAQKVATESCKYLGAHGICESADGVRIIENITHMSIEPITVFENSLVTCPKCHQAL